MGIDFFGERCPSGQRGRAVNPLSHDFEGSTPSLSTRNFALQNSCGSSSMVECQPSKLATRVRFPSPAHGHGVENVFFGTVQKCPDARRLRTREEAYLNGTLTKRVCEQRRRRSFFNSPADIAQTAEHFHGKEGVRSSILRVGSL